MTSSTAPALTIRTATVADAALIAEIGASTFHDTFSADNTPENMAAYMTGAFGEALQRAELADDRITVFLAERDGDVAGYVMLRDVPSPDVVPGHSIEIARLYAVKQHIGARVGAALMQRCIDEAAARGRSAIWLGVWERNTRAIAFYERWGFTDVGRLAFQLGDDRQTDHIMMRPVAPGER